MKENPELTAHLAKHGFTAKEVAWPLMRTLFTKQIVPDWQQFLDFLFFNAPQWLLYFTGAFVIESRAQLM